MNFESWDIFFSWIPSRHHLRFRSWLYIFGSDQDALWIQFEHDFDKIYSDQMKQVKFHSFRGSSYLQDARICLA